ncbi:MAG: DsbA family protein [bacterium]|nr:DsbA family protein [bacterium]
MNNKIVRLFARISAALLILHLFFFWAAERSGEFMGFEPAHFKDTALLFFLIAVYLLLESHFIAREREVVEEEIVSITEESSSADMSMGVSAGQPVWKNPYIVSALIVGAALIVAGVLISGPREGAQKAGQGLPSQAPIAPAAPQAPAPGQKVAVTWGETPILNKNAKVQFIEFGDFECPFCGRFFTDSMVQIKKKYVDTGKIAFQHRDYPLPFHPNAQKAAEAARCALEQSEKQYWTMHDWMYQNQTNLAVASLKSQAKTMGLNASKFDQCLDSGKYAAAVKKDYDAGSGYGVSGTPSFFVDGELVVGAQPYATFEQKIEAALAAK